MSATTKTELMQALSLSSAELSAALKALNIPEATAYTPNQANLITEYVTRPDQAQPQPQNPAPTQEPEPTGFDLEGINQEALSSLATAEAQGYAAQVQRGMQRGFMGAALEAAAEMEGYVRAQQLRQGLVQPETPEEVQIFSMFQRMNNAFVPGLPAGVTVKNGQLVLNTQSLVKPKQITSSR